MEKSINQLQFEIHDNAMKKGFWEEPVNVAEKLMLVVSEVSEMCEADRKNNRCKVLPQVAIPDDNDFKDYFEVNVKDTFEDEMADTMIRLLDMAHKFDVPLYDHIISKMRYNSLRPYKHGKKY
jgi:NTP pyrophosphatase (non-canonical NTP hydrolase)